MKKRVKFFTREYNAYSKAILKAREASIKYLTEVVKSFEGSVNVYFEDCPCCVTYDGGNHPEYNANPYSWVHSVYLNKKNELCLDIDDCSEYGVNYVDGCELIDLAGFIDENMEAIEELNEENEDDDE